MTTPSAPVRLTQYAAGGGCACKIPPGELEDVVRGLGGQSAPDLLVGLDDGDDGAVVRVADGMAVISTADFFTPVVDDAYDFGRIVAANALSDVYAMGGRPVLAINLVGWPRSVLPLELLREVLRGGLDVAREAGCPVAGGHSIDDPEPKYGMAVTGVADPDCLLREVLRGGLDVAREAGCPVAGGHSIDDPEPKYGMAVTGVADPDRLLRNDSAQPGLPISLTKPIGVGVLNNRHKATGEVFPHAVASMVALNDGAGAAAVAAGARAATDVTGFGLLGHLYKLLRASAVGAVLDAAAVPVLEGAWESLREGYVSGGTRRNLDWVRPHLDGDASQDVLLMLADAQTSGGLLVVGEVPGAPVIGHTVAGPARIEIR